MTPTEQDKELRLEIARKVYPRPTPGEILIWGSPEAVIDEVYSEAPIVYEFASYITADRKRVALEARIDEISHVFRIVDGRIFWQSDISLAMPLEERIAELKAQQEEV